MKNINVNVQRPPTNIPLGRQGENLATCIIFDCTGLAQLYGDGTAELLHELKDGTIYPVAVTQDGASVSWAVSASDTATVGAGRAELRWYVGDTLAKSAKFRTSVSSALADTTTETPPAPYQSWVDKVLAAAQEIKDGAISDEKLAAAIAAYLEEHPIDAGLDEAALAAYLVENGYLKNTDLADAIAQALAEAKASGQFDGAPGKDGTDGAPGADGKDGADGQPGADGVTPNIQIGTVETLPAGSDATASITGTPENPLLNLGIPQGAGGGSLNSGKWEVIHEFKMSEITPNEGDTVMELSADCDVDPDKYSAILLCLQANSKDLGDFNELDVYTKKVGTNNYRSHTIFMNATKTVSAWNIIYQMCELVKMIDGQPLFFKTSGIAASGVCSKYWADENLFVNGGVKITSPSGLKNDVGVITLYGRRCG